MVILASIENYIVWINHLSSKFRHFPVGIRSGALVVFGMKWWRWPQLESHKYCFRNSGWRLVEHLYVNINRLNHNKPCMQRQLYWSNFTILAKKHLSEINKLIAYRKLFDEYKANNYLFGGLSRRSEIYLEQKTREFDKKYHLSWRCSEAKQFEELHTLCSD